MISWLENILGTVPTEYRFVVVIGATVLVILCVVSVFQALFTPLRRFK